VSRRLPDRWLQRDLEDVVAAKANLSHGLHHWETDQARDTRSVGKGQKLVG
jgi:ribosomal protein L35